LSAVDGQKGMCSPLAVVGVRSSEFSQAESFSRQVSPESYDSTAQARWTPDPEAPETPLPWQGTTAMTRVMSLNSCSPAGAREWRSHMQRRITSKMTKGHRPAPVRRVATFLGTTLSVLNMERLGGLTTKIQSETNAASKRWPEHIVDSMCFEVTCGAMVIANVVAVGWQQDVFLRAAMGNAAARFCTDCFDVSNAALLAAFLSEVLFRMCAKRCKYFIGNDWKWNVADLMMAIFALVEYLILHTYRPYVQVVRTCRLVRVHRAVRSVRAFRDLRLMMWSLSQSLVSLFSALALLFAVIYLFSICFMHAAATYVEGGQVELTYELKANYGSLSSTMYTLLLAISNGADWRELAAPLGRIHWGFEMLFTFYVFFVVIGVLNVLTSSFVERARELSMLDRDLATHRELASQEAFLAEMRTIFEEVDNENDGRITWQKFRDYLKSDQAQAFFATQQLDTSDAARLFSLLDVDAAGAVRIEEFALGCMRLRGPAKSSDMAALLKETKVQRRSARDLRKISAQLDCLCGALSFLGAEPSGAMAAAAHESAARWVAG
jgi:hypothetical protein